MYDIYFWITFFGAPLFIVLLTAYVFRPSVRQHYHEAKQVIFADDKVARPANNSKSDAEKMEA